MTRLLLSWIALLLFDLYVYQAVRRVMRDSRFKKVGAAGYWALTLYFLTLTLWVFLAFSRKEGPSALPVKITMASFVLIYIPKLVVFLFLLLEDKWRALRALVVFLRKLILGRSPVKGYFEPRRKFLSQAAGMTAMFPAIGIFYGIVKGKYNYKIHPVTIRSPHLPEAFHGTTITQVSDLHAGSWDDPEEMKRAAELVQQQNSDLLFFTGDLVNNYVHEMERWAPLFSQWRAPMGKYAILGNHDYGDYGEWDSKEAKENNNRELYELYDTMGFQLLRNSNTEIRKGESFIELLGMENWGKGFQKYGDFEKTLNGTREEAFRILLSHDPSHWDAEVVNHKKDIHLTLSGHTHGMQFGVEVPGFRFSPVQFRYDRWAGLYMENERCLYVNRGLGFIGFPGRVGIWPEITVITLEKA